MVFGAAPKRFDVLIFCWETAPPAGFRSGNLKHFKDTTAITELVTPEQRVKNLSLSDNFPFLFLQGRDACLKRSPDY